MDRPIWRICRPPLLPLPSLTAASGPVKHSNRWTANTSLLVWAHGRYVATYRNFNGHPAVRPS
jgi:hypothetical protein